MSMRTVRRIAALASAAALATGISIAAPTGALAAPQPNGEPTSCAVGSYCLYLNSDFTGVDAIGNAKVSNMPLGATITSVENDTLWTVVLRNGSTVVRTVKPNTRVGGFSVFVTSYTVS